MKSAPLPAVVLALVCAFLALAVPVSASVGSGSKGVLTASEYQRLNALQVAIKKAYSGVFPNWKAAEEACLSLGNSTNLLRSTRAQCTAEVADLHAWLNLQSKKCSGTVLAQLICMDPGFQRLARVVPQLRVTDLRLRAAGVARGFTSNCLITLVATRLQLSTEKSYISAVQRVAADIATLVRVAKTRTPSSAMMEQEGTDQASMLSARQYWLGQAIGYQLSVCPHA